MLERKCEALMNCPDYKPKTSPLFLPPSNYSHPSKSPSLCSLTKFYVHAGIELKSVTYGIEEISTVKPDSPYKHKVKPGFLLVSRKHYFEHHPNPHRHTYSKRTILHFQPRLVHVMIPHIFYLDPPCMETIQFPHMGLVLSSSLQVLQMPAGSQQHVGWQLIRLGSCGPLKSLLEFKKALSHVSMGSGVEIELILPQTQTQPQTIRITFTGPMQTIQIPRPFSRRVRSLGVDLNPDLTIDVYNDISASSYGLKQGDKLISVNRKHVDTVEEFYQFLLASVNGNNGKTDPGCSSSSPWTSLQLIFEPPQVFIVV